MAIMNPILRLSGGAANADPLLSLGGVMSAEEIASYQTLALRGGEIVLAGLDIVGGCRIPDETDFYTMETFGSNSIKAFPNGDTSNALITGVGGEVGRYWIPSSTVDGAFIATDADKNNIDGSQHQAIYDVVNRIPSSHLLFPEVSKEDALNGITQYRCLYIDNGQSTNTRIVVMWIDEQPILGEAISLGLTQTVPDIVEPTIGDDTTEPAGILSWDSANTEAAGKIMAVSVGGFFGIWIRRTIPPFTTTVRTLGTFSLGISVV